jgi:hypothetical protein
VTTFLAIYLQPDSMLAPLQLYRWRQYVHSKHWDPPTTTIWCHNQDDHNNLFLSLQLAGHKLKQRSAVLQIYDFIYGHTESVLKLYIEEHNVICTFNTLWLILKV